MSTPGEILPPRYAGVRRIGYGGMGDIYAADDRELGRPVAIKVLADRFSADPNVRSRFKREALTAARLSGHPHIVTIYDVGEWNDRPFIVMELLPEGSLFEKTREGKVEPARAFEWLEDTADALDAAHREGIVHRDVKPANLLFDARCEVKVADFGIARVLDETTGSMTATGTILGTSGYLSPEQARGEPASAASDLYSLAVVAYELLVGKRPFERATATAEAAAHINEPVPPASEQNPELPPQVDAVFAQALSKDPARRHASAPELVADLRAALLAGEQPTRIVSPAPVPVAAAETVRADPAPRAPEPHRTPSRRWLLPALIAGALLLGGGVLAAALLTDNEKDAQPETVTTAVRDTVTEKVTLPTETREVRVIRTHTVTTSPAETDKEETDPEEPPPSPPPGGGSAVSVDQAVALTDEGTGLISSGDYAGALAVMQRALPPLQGTYRSDFRYEAYANYNYGRSLLGVGRCGEALAYLDRSEQLQGKRKEISEARKAAERCQ